MGSRGRVTLPEPPTSRVDLRLADIVDADGDWWPPPRLTAFLLSLSPIQESRVTAYQARAETGFFGAFRRTRNGVAVWEVRADEKSGALRTTRGGSAKQAVLRAGRGALAVVLAVFLWTAVEVWGPQVLSVEGIGVHSPGTVSTRYRELAPPG